MTWWFLPKLPGIDSLEGKAYIGAWAWDAAARDMCTLMGLEARGLRSRCMSGQALSDG